MMSKVSWDSGGINPVAESPGDRRVAVVESDIYRSLQTVLRELDNNTSATCHSKGMLRWTLHKKVQNNPLHCVLLIKILVRELEKAGRSNCKTYLVPLLHTLIYTIIQSAYIPSELLQRAYETCRRLLTLPHPYCTISLTYTRHLKTEMTTPGALFQKKVLAEQSLQNVSFPFQEKVFVFADPAVIPDHLAACVGADVELEGTAQSQQDHMCAVVQHTLQAALGEACEAVWLEQALRDLSCNVKPYFHQVVATLAEHVGRPSSELKTYHTTLQQIYSDILATAQQVPDPCIPCRSCTLPNPVMTFRVWRTEGELWSAVEKLICVNPTEQNSSSQGLDVKGLLTPCFSTPSQSNLSRDSGIERDITVARPTDPPLRLQQQVLLTQQEMKRHEQERKPFMSDETEEVLERSTRSTRNPGLLKIKTGISNLLPKEEHPFTARIIVMGDDRSMGRLAKAYYFLRQREAKHPRLTGKVNIEFYYIPVGKEFAPASVAQENDLAANSYTTLASYLGKVDPWYHCNIISLGYMIPKMAKMQPNSRKVMESDFFLRDVIAYYTRTGVQPVHFLIYSVKISFSDPAKESVADVFFCHLNMDVPQVKFLDLTGDSFKNKKNLVEMYGTVVSVNCKKVSVSSREEDVRLLLKTCSVSVSVIPPKEKEDLGCLTVSFDDAGSLMESSIRTCGIKIRTLEEKTFTVSLDKDSRRTFTQVQSIEISPCLDPGYALEKVESKSKSKFNPRHGQEEKEKWSNSKDPVQWLTLPLNTFTGISC
ncbi:phosphoinositide 3-kinase regulatory subunit 6-like isoform X2 [Arapaima gigas]